VIPFVDELVLLPLDDVAVACIAIQDQSRHLPREACALFGSVGGEPLGKARLALPIEQKDEVDHGWLAGFLIDVPPSLLSFLAPKEKKNTTEKHNKKC
jgi:hypothetical protein